MEVEEVSIDSTTIKFFDDFLVESMEESNLSSFESILLNAVKKIMKFNDL